jgi:hypothetical protein
VRITDRPFILWLWTDDPAVARKADRAGIDRIGLDCETLGKSHRQAGHGTWISQHEPETLGAVAAQVGQAEIFVRTNSVHDGIGDEIEAFLERGATVLMLPNFRTLSEIETYADKVDGRARIVPLVERLDAIELIPRFPELGIEEFHVGLNDLSIELGLPNRMELLVRPEMRRIADAAEEAGATFGIGGLARPDAPGLPVDPALVCAVTVGLGSSGALIARSFGYADLDDAAFARAIRDLRVALGRWRTADASEIDAARAAFAEAVVGRTF